MGTVISPGTILMTLVPFTYRALIDLKEQFLEEKGVRHNLTPGMQVTDPPRYPLYPRIPALAGDGRVS